MTVRDVLQAAGSRLGRLGWLLGLALAVILAACSPNGTSTY